VAVAGGRIEAVGTAAAQRGDQVVRVDGDIVTAGLVNTHHHFCQWLTRGWAFDCTLFGWLTTLYPVWARLTPEDVEAAAAVALGKLALTGCTTAPDHHYLVPGGDDSVFDAIAAAARRIGLRAHVARGSMDLGQSRGGLPPGSVVEDLDAILPSTQAVHERLHDGDRIVVTVAPCSPFSVTPELMTASAGLARRLGLRLHTHLAETLDEERACLGRDDVGRLEPGYRADLVIWPGDDLADVLDPLAGLVLGSERHARHVLVGGHYVVRDGRLLGADMEALRRDLARRARRLWPENAR
jgi:cytosine/adenosine deaminase-related metal-dependent hydrolase